MRGQAAALLVFVSLCAGCSGSAIDTTAPTTTAGAGLRDRERMHARAPDGQKAREAPQLTIPAVIGTYCVEVYDSGQLGGVGRTFSVTIAHS